MPTQTFNYTGGWQTFNVPTDVTSVTVTVDGGGSGLRAGGRVTGRIAVNGSQTLYIAVGRAGFASSGSDGGAGGWPNGGDGSDGFLSGGGGGGDGGGGASFIRVNSQTGTIKAVAGGAGGDSGDSGQGGMGGAGTGENGLPGSSGSGAVGNATGGTQTQGGNGGTSSSGDQFNGQNATDHALAPGGHGGWPGSTFHHGGGGGGGGYRSGGGGQASSATFTPGGGGGGGSNYTGGMTGPTSVRGGGGTGNGSVVVTWVSPPPANQPPSPPSSVEINGQPETDGMMTKATTQETVSAIIDDPNASDRVRLLVRRSTSSSFATFTDTYSTYGAQAQRRTVTLKNLKVNTRYYLRLYTQDDNGRFSTSYNSANFWTNRKPTAELQCPENATQFANSLSMTFGWNFVDPDPSTTQKAWELRWRAVGSSTWTIKSGTGGSNCIGTGCTGDFCYTTNPFTFRSNQFYVWSVRVKDEAQWSDWTPVQTFYATGLSTAPRLLDPINEEAVNATLPRTFKWKFIDPNATDSQCKADIRYRVVGTGGPDGIANWVTLLGNLDSGTPPVPGSNQSWEIPAGTFTPGFHYEWQARTYDGGPACSSPLASDWSDSETFWATGDPGSEAGGPPIPQRSDIQGSLGCGTYRVFIYDRGGQKMRGEITPIAHLLWHRKRDDISHCLITTNGFGDDCCQLLAALRSWMHEIVVFRDGERVWEGPVTRITYKPNEVEIEAKDVMAYVYRRILKQGYNDTYQVVNGEQLGVRRVTDRALLITVNALAPDDPNVLPYLTAIVHEDDARESRIVPPYSRTAWEEIDDLAATGGLDYVTVGRRIIYWDTHKPIGKLPELRDKDFSDPPVVTEYGMQLANQFAVTNNSGVWGAVYATEADPNDPTNPEARIPVPEKYYGRIEQLASAYGEASGGGETTLTQEQIDSLRTTLTGQAARNIAGRWPTPLVVRVPDNSALSPDVNLGIQQLVPGVHIPLRATGTCRTVTQWQKLDSITVEATDKTEQVRVVMSPAPDEFRDPDQDAAEQEAD